jgi:hypothetical protein
MFKGTKVGLLRSDTTKEMSMPYDTPPSDAEVLSVIDEAQGAIAPTNLLDNLCAKGYTQDSAIKAIQRVYDRGFVQLNENAELVPLEPFRAKVAAAA